MKAGPLRQRVTIERLREVRDGYGQMVQSWVPSGIYWAEIRNLGGREAVNAKQIRAEVTHAVRMRFIGGQFPAPGILPSMRLLFGTRTFNLLWVNDVDYRRREYQMLAQEIAAAVPTEPPVTIETGDQLLLETAGALVLQDETYLLLESG